ncbi:MULTISPECIES: RICIN domain-containing protein [unclassified Nocardioides]|uniref:RICIN domain-containing protein n=1 Tax=unclassified Nocardioides TaxID=2615069 RepID=UPI0009E90D82|nr:MULTISPECIES: RICIN domain-containing protein [unclassified Nocardioides]
MGDQQRRALAVFVVVLAGLLALPVGASAGGAGPAERSAVAGAAPPSSLERTVTHDGRTLKVRLTRVNTRAPEFEVLVQQASGALVATAAPAERSYLGTVDGVPGASVAAVLRSDGKVEGLIAFDRGGTWQFVDSTVVGTRGLSQPATYKWPSATDASRNVTVVPGQVGSRTYRWSVGYDLANRWFSDAATVTGSVARALDAVELNTVLLQLAYETDARLRPATGRVIVRASASAEPYAGYDSPLGDVREEWRTAQADSGADAVALWHGGAGGGGVAYLRTIASDWGVSANGGTGTPWVVTRHELGHVWGADDNHTNGPEGATINSGNQFHRFDGTELSAILRLRNDRLVRAVSPFEVVPAQTVPLPPYAALDLVIHQTSGTAFSFRPTANDHDANGNALALAGVASRSQLGGRLSYSGNVVTYVPPAVSSRTTDFVRYVVRDSTGRTATGVVLFRVDPAPRPGPVSSWPAISVADATGYALVNAQSGLRMGRSSTGALVQRGAAGTLTSFKVRRLTGYAIRRVGGGCLEARSDGAVVIVRCRAIAAQRFRFVKHPVTGTAVVSARFGTCLHPDRASMTSGAKIRHRRCGLSLAMSWGVRAPDVSTWGPVAPAAGQRSLVQLGSGRPAGVPAAASGNSELLIREPDGTATRVIIARNANGTYQLRNALTGRCYDAYGTGPGGQVGTYSCGTQENQQWRVLANPAGGLSFRLVRGGLCLGVTNRSLGTGLTMNACGLGVGVRWRIDT